MRQIEYRVVSGSNMEELQQAVNRRLQTKIVDDPHFRWVCQGGINVVISGNYQMLTQAMVCVEFAYGLKSEKGLTK